MNFLAHALTFLDDPLRLIGSATPDLLSVADRRVRVPANRVRPWLDHSDSAVAALAAGIVRHHHDDEWFHRQWTFLELTSRFTLDARQRLGDDDGHRSALVGHVLVEILLDAALLAESPERLAGYYRAFETVDPRWFEQSVNAMSRGTTDRLAEMFERFRRERLLTLYADDDLVVECLSRVLRRVALPPLPQSFRELVATARPLVALRRHELLTPG